MGQVGLWAHGPKVMVPRCIQVPPPAVALVILYSRIIRELSYFPPNCSSHLGIHDPTVLPLLACVGVLGWPSAQLRRGKCSEGEELRPGQQFPPLSLVPRALSALAERHVSGKGYGNSELGVFKVTPDQAKPPNWQPCIPFLCESTTGWLLS